MPNYSLVINSKFRPLSYDEIVRPLQQQTDVQNAYEDALSALETEASVWENRINRETDKKAAEQYQKYANDLRARANALATNGLNPGSRRAMLDMKRRYAAEITPIQEAYTRRAALADEQRKALTDNPTMLYERMANTMSLDDFLNNPQADYGKKYSGALLAQQSSQAAAAIAKELTEVSKDPRLLDQYTKLWQQRHGVKSIDVQKAVADIQAGRGISEDNPVLKAIYDQVAQSSGIIDYLDGSGRTIKGWGDRSTQQEAANYIASGLWNAVGQTQVSTYEDYGKKLAAQERMQRRVQNNPPSSLGRINPTNLYSAAEETKYNKINKGLAKYSQYFITDKKGNIIDLSDDGKDFANKRRRLNSDQKYTSADGKKSVTVPGSGSWVNSEFRELLKDLGFNTSGYISRGKGQRDNLQKIAKAASGEYDATRTTVFTHDYEPSEYNAVRELVGRALGTSNAVKVDYDSKSKSYKNIGEFKKTDLFKKDDSKGYNFDIIASRGSSKGLTYIVRSSNGAEQFEIQVPGVNRAQEKSALDAYAEAEKQLISLQREGISPFEESTMNEAYANALWAAEQALGNIVYRNKTESQKF